MKNLKETPSSDHLLELYGYYKQSTVGDVNTGRKCVTLMVHLNTFVYNYNDLCSFLFSAKPGLLDFKGKAKWESWNNKKGMSTDEAKAKYVEVVNKLVDTIGIQDEL